MPLIQTLICSSTIALALAGCRCREETVLESKEKMGFKAAITRCREYYRSANFGKWAPQGLTKNKQSFPDWRSRQSWNARKTPCKNPFFPDWKVGQSWVVKYTMQPHPLERGPEKHSTARESIVEYRVSEDGEDIDGRAVYTLLLYENGQTQDPLLLITVSKGTGVLRRINHGNKKNADHFYFTDQAQLHVRRSTWGTIEDFGDFCSISPSNLSTSARESSRLQKKYTVKESNNQSLIEYPRKCDTPPCDAPFLQEIVFHKDRGEMVLRLVAKNRWSEKKSGIKGGIIFTEQRWKLGKPWWSSAKKVAGRDAFITGELLCP